MGFEISNSWFNSIHICLGEWLCFLLYYHFLKHVWRQFSFTQLIKSFRILVKISFVEGVDHGRDDGSVIQVSLVYDDKNPNWVVGTVSTRQSPAVPLFPSLYLLCDLNLCHKLKLCLLLDHPNPSKLHSFKKYHKTRRKTRHKLYQTHCQHLNTVPNAVRSLTHQCYLQVCNHPRSPRSFYYLSLPRWLPGVRQLPLGRGRRRWLVSYLLSSTYCFKFQFFIWRLICYIWMLWIFFTIWRSSPVSITHWTTPITNHHLVGQQREAMQAGSVTRAYRCACIFLFLDATRRGFPLFIGVAFVFDATKREKPFFVDYFIHF